MQERMLCPRHAHIRLEVREGVLICPRCQRPDAVLEPAELITMTQLWNREVMPSYDELIEGVDKSIMEFLWLEQSGTLINLFLYFNSEKKPLDPREFLMFWGSLVEEEQDYYMIASAEGLRDEAKEER